ncbi:DUF2066 domain-containing protein [Shewanella youngdeokensis]|uniref:DUF2066 domain-containing protein n=1 Tax=Shewanella youngdeokensis TaxID=2999068 RepID=A0ABZ0JTT8_9GAMM|nr:DUF2066 domain-containing protein [Shewanella sp. DAU334]
MLRFMYRYLMMLTLFVSVFNQANATEIGHLDESLVLIESRAIQLRDQAIKKGLEDVILKNSGTQRALSHPDVVKQLANAKGIMTQYGYQELDGELLLQVSFDHQRVISLLRQAGLPVWGAQRPLTLVWLVEDGATERQILADESQSPTREAFNTQADNRGVPLLFPLMDLDDAMQVGVNDIRGQFTDTVANASSRYQSNYFIVATVATVDIGFEYQMSLYPVERAKGSSQHTAITNRSGRVATIEEAVIAITTATSEYYVGQYAIADSGEKLTTKIAFTDITQMKQIVEIEQYLNQLSAVKSVSIAQVKGQDVEFNVALFGDEDDLHRLIKLDSRIAVMSDITSTRTRSSGLESVGNVDKQTQIYYWKGQ